MEADPAISIQLPIVQPQHIPSADAMVRAVKRAGVIAARTGAQETPLQAATALTNASRPGVWSENFATDLLLPDGTDATTVWDEVATHFEGHGVPCHLLEAVEEPWPEALAQWAEDRGYQPVIQQVYLLANHPPPDRLNSDLQIIPARAAYGELGGFYHSMARDEYGAGPQQATDWAGAMIDRLDEPRLELFLGRIAGVPVGVAGVTTLGQIGVVSEAYTDKRYRGGGVASGLINHTLDYCARAQMGQVILSRSKGCPSIGFYESVGFKKIASYTQYVQR